MYCHLIYTFNYMQYLLNTPADQSRAPNYSITVPSLYHTYIQYYRTKKFYGTVYHGDAYNIFA